jgi:hypothetical protein
VTSCLNNTPHRRAWQVHGVDNLPLINHCKNGIVWKDKRPEIIYETQTHEIHHSPGVGKDPQHSSPEGEGHGAWRQASICRQTAHGKSETLHDSRRVRARKNYPQLMLGEKRSILTPPMKTAMMQTQFATSNDATNVEPFSAQAPFGAFLRCRPKSGR